MWISPPWVSGTSEVFPSRNLPSKQRACLLRNATRRKRTQRIQNPGMSLEKVWGSDLQRLRKKWLRDTVHMKHGLRKIQPRFFPCAHVPIGRSLLWDHENPLGYVQRSCGPIAPSNPHLRTCLTTVAPTSFLPIVHVIVKQIPTENPTA